VEPKAMDITVILCTYNRCQKLARTLTSIAEQSVPAEVSWEVLVIDNNSTDKTREAVEEINRAHPNRFRYFFEPRQGKSNALNLGIQNAVGEVLAFVDDDVIAETTWLRNLTWALLSEDWAGAGGRILPEKGFTPPKWIATQEPHALSPLVVFDPKQEAGPLHVAPFGANMAFRRRVFEQYGRFRLDLGPQPGLSPQKCEDSEFGRRLLMAGERLRYEPSAVIYHEVPATRVQKYYFLKWWHDKARSDIRAFGIPVQSGWFICGVPVSLFRRLAFWTLRWLVAIEPKQRFSCKLKAWRRAGEISECFQQRQPRQIVTRTKLSRIDAGSSWHDSIED